MGSYSLSSSFSAMSVTCLVPLSCLFALASSQCTTTGGPASGSACVFPFKYADQTFYTCTNSGGFAPWCYTQVDSQGNGVQGQYGDCGSDAACTSECVTTGGPSTGAACVFPFVYAGSTYTSCTTDGGHPAWCYTQVDSQGKGVSGRYGDCGTSPACSGATTTTTTVDACVAACPATCSAPTTTSTTTTTTPTTTSTTTSTTTTTTTTTTTITTTTTTTTTT